MVFECRPPIRQRPRRPQATLRVTRDEALRLVREFVKNEALVRHMLAVEAAMRGYAVPFGEDPEPWGLAGLLHDFDWEIHPTLDHHPQDGAPILRARGVPELVVRCILSHAEHTGVPANPGWNMPCSPATR